MMKLSAKHLVIPAAVVYGLIVFWLIASDTEPTPAADDRMASLKAVASAGP